jgi:hypothetical protein
MENIEHILDHKIRDFEESFTEREERNRKAMMAALKRFSCRLRRKRKMILRWIHLVMMMPTKRVTVTLVNKVLETRGVLGV